MNRKKHKNEGVVGYLFNQPYEGTVPLYRLYDKRDEDHFCSSNECEIEMLSGGYKIEDPVDSFISVGSIEGEGLLVKRGQSFVTIPDNSICWDEAYENRFQKSGNNLYLMDQKLGLGINDPEEILHIKGNVKIEGTLSIGNSILSYNEANQQLVVTTEKDQVIVNGKEGNCCCCNEGDKTIIMDESVPVTYPIKYDLKDEPHKLFHKDDEVWTQIGKEDIYGNPLKAKIYCDGNKVICQLKTEVIIITNRPEKLTVKIYCVKTGLWETIIDEIVTEKIKLEKVLNILEKTDYLDEDNALNYLIITDAQINSLCATTEVIKGDHYFLVNLDVDQNLVVNNNWRIKIINDQLAIQKTEGDGWLDVAYFDSVS